MYNVHGFGKRIAAYRKLVGLTQEELAARLNITAQAVSKWENEISFPEITIRPQLAHELNTTIEKLFGNSERQDGESPFPEAKGELKLVHTFRNVGCYSDKEVDVTTLTNVVFKDGSHADLQNLEVINKGPGHISFEFAHEPYHMAAVDSNKTELNEVFNGINSLSLSISSASFTVRRSADQTTRMKATGSPVFIGSLEVRQNGHQLLVTQKQHQNYPYSEKDRVEILFGKDCGSELFVKISGSGSGSIEIPFQQAQVGISGSGDLHLNDVEQLRGKISGSGSVKAKKVGKAELGISGAGDMHLEEITGELDTQISGAGDITIKSGQVDVFKARVSGAGDIKAQGVTARTADLSCRGAGDIVLGRVIEESIERHSKMSSIRILKRG